MPDRGNDETLGVPAPIWLGDDPVRHLRAWVTDQIYPMPEAGEVVIGSAPDAAWQLVEPGRSVSRRHARVIRVEGGWEIEDLHSRLGLHRDGERTHKRVLITPGMEIGIGSITLIAENATLIRLRHYLARVLGWNTADRPAIDLAMRAVRGAALRRGSLVLAGADDLVPVARQIHLRATPPKSPFIVYGKLLESDASLRLMGTTAGVATALELAAGGTVCVRADKPRDGYDDLEDKTSLPQAVAQLYQCIKKVKRGEPTPRGIVVVRKLAGRSAEDIERIVDEYAHDAARELGVDPTGLTEQDRAWVIRRETRSFAEVEIATLRFVASRAFSSVNQAAAYLGLSHNALGDWLRRRRFRP